MDDYISREAAIEAALDYSVDVIENDYDRGYEKAVRDIAKELNTIPAADVVSWEWLERFAEGRRIEYGAGMHWNYARDFVKEAKEAYKNERVLQ